MIQLRFGPGPGWHIEGIPDGTITPQVRAQLQPPPCPACGVPVRIQWINVATFADDPQNPPVIPGPWECRNECHPQFRRCVVAPNRRLFDVYCMERGWNSRVVIYLPGDRDRSRVDSITRRLLGAKIHPGMVSIVPGSILTVEDIHTFRVCLDPRFSSPEHLAGTDLGEYMDQVAREARRRREVEERYARPSRVVFRNDENLIDLTPYVDQIQFSPDGMEVSVDLRGEVGELPAWARRIAQDAQAGLSIGFEAEDPYVDVFTMDGRTERIRRRPVQRDPHRGRTAEEVRAQVARAQADADAILNRISEAVEEDWHPGPDAARWTPGDPTP